MSHIYENKPTSTQAAVSLKAAQRFGAGQAAVALDVLSRYPGFEKTQILSMHEIAKALGVGSVFVKDERQRLSMGSFKALGGSYAVLKLAAEADAKASGKTLSLANFLARQLAIEASKRQSLLTVTTATAGNHGRSVAAGAAIAGAKCYIFVYDGVPEDQIAAIAKYGAKIVRISGVYEDAVAASVKHAEEEGWIVVSDSSWEGYTDIPAQIMEGYTVMAAEAFAQLETPPTHIFLQAGVGGLAGAVAAHAAAIFSKAKPNIIVVEPDAAPCLYASAFARTMRSVPTSKRTNMGRLECYTPSLLAWNILNGIADAFVAVSDEEAIEAVRELNDHGVMTSPSGAAGFAGLRVLSRRDVGKLSLSEDSRILIFVTEEATVADRKLLAA